MNAKFKHNRQMRSLSIAFAASILAAVATMFVPVAVLESITGASGLSELVPATAAPLGDTARALIAFGAGALTLALMAVVMLRQNATETAQPPQTEPDVGIAEDDDRDFMGSMKERIAKLSFPKMPWVKGDDDITDLADLPKLRGGDSHPDAPARRPLSANQDLPVLDLTGMAVEPVRDVATELSPKTYTEPLQVNTEVQPPKPTEPPASDPQPSLAAMVAQLEASVAQRQLQLAELEIVAENLAASKSSVMQETSGVESETPAKLEMPLESVRPEWPPLEAVPSSPEKQDDMDEALAAALATLHRMNGTVR